MFPIHRLLSRLPRLKSSKRLLYLAAFLIFFWCFFDGILSYLVPILITQRGYTDTQMGLIFAFSSVAGAVFDFILTRILKHTNYLRLFLLILVISFIFPLVLWFSNTLLLYLLAMAIWGLYYDLYTFASYDFVAHNSKSEDSCFDFSIIELFRSTAGFLSPLLAAYMIIEKVEFFNVSFSLFFLIIASVLYLFFFNLSPVHFFHHQEKRVHASNFFNEFRLWRGAIRFLYPTLIFMVVMYISDAVFWTIGPIFSKSFPDFKYFSGFFMTLYNLPSLLTTWKIESITSRFGKRQTAFVSFLLANLFLIPVGLVGSPFLVLVLVFLSSCACSVTWPSIEGALVDHISESHKYQPEIEGLTDFTANIGYIFGPILAGVFADKIGISHSFMVLGLVNFIFILLLFKLAPKNSKVTLPAKSSSLPKLPLLSQKLS